MTRYVIVGNGVAGMAAIGGIRQHDQHGSITLVAAEPHPTYFRAALSEWMHGAIDEAKLQVRPAAFYARHAVRTIQDVAVRVDVEGRRLHLAGGEELGWDRLLIATGAEPWAPPWPGRQLDGFFTYRTFEDSAAIRDRVQRRPDLPAVIAGGGILGLEFAWDCHGLGVDAVMLVRDDRVGSPIFDRGAGEAIGRRLTDAGVTVHFGDEVERIEGDSDALQRVVTKAGRTIECSVVVAATGVRAATALLDGTVIEVDRQVVVDERLRTSVPDVFAAGDVATVWDPLLQRHEPTRTWEPSYLCGRVAGVNMAGGDERFVPCTAMNASLVYDLNYVLLGAFAAEGEPGVEAVVAPNSRGPYGYRKVLLKDGVPIGGTFVQDRRQFLVWKRLLETRTDVGPWRDRLFDDDFDLNLALPPGGLDYYFF
jgi:NAD(P)H-nitrite reductase large subunit